MQQIARFVAGLVLLVAVTALPATAPGPADSAGRACPVSARQPCRSSACPPAGVERPARRRSRPGYTPPQVPDLDFYYLKTLDGVSLPAAGAEPRLRIRHHDAIVRTA